MQLPWRTVGWVSLDVLGIILCFVAMDCLATGWRDLRRGERDYDRRIGALTAGTGLVLLLIGAALLWWAHAVRFR